MRKVCDEILRFFLNTRTNDVASVANKAVGGRRAFKIGCSISNHDNFQLSFGLQLTRVVISDLRDRFTFSTAAACRLIHIKTDVVSIEIKKQLVCEEIGDWNLKFLCDGINE